MITRLRGDNGRCPTLIAGPESATGTADCFMKKRFARNRILGTKSPSHRENVMNLDTTLSVTLARQKILLARVLAMVPGAILTFSKHYADPLELEAAGLPIAHGEIVKIGDKFGVRILEVLQPTAE